MSEYVPALVGDHLILCLAHSQALVTQVAESRSLLWIKAAATVLQQANVPINRLPINHPFTTFCWNRDK